MNRTQRLTLTTLALLTACGLAACNGGGRHGNYTKEGVANAQQRLAEMKSGTEWQMAQQQYLGGDLDKALKTVDRSLTLNPNVPKSNVLRGRILLEKGDVDKARASFDRALELDPENVDANYYLGIVHERYSQDEKALSFYQTAMNLDSSNPQYLIAASEMLVNLGRMDEAEQLLLSKKESFGYSAAVRQTLGHISVLRGQHAQAANYFNDAILLAPEDPAILEDLARSQIACGKFADAEFNLGRLLRMDQNKDRRDLQMLRAKCLLTIDRPVEARTLVQQVTNSPEGQNDPEAWVLLGNAASVLKDRGNLRLAGARTNALAPERFEGYFFKAQFHNIESQKTEALSLVDKAIERSGNNTAPFVLKATILQDLGQWQEAQKTMASALERNPNDRVAQMFKSTLDQQGNNSTVTGVSTENGNE